MGNIIAFKYVLKKNPNNKTKVKSYTGEYASTDLNKRVDASGIASDDGRRIEVLSTWYTCSNDGVFTQFDNNHFFVGINNYVATVNMLSIDIINIVENSLAVPSEHLVDLKNSLYKLFVK